MKNGVTSQNGLIRAGTLTAFGGLVLLLTGCAAAPAAPPPATAAAPDSGWGLVQMECRGDEGGMSSDCRVLSEQPPGRGFGASALETARRNPVPLERGTTIRYTVRFSLDASGPAKPLT